MSKKRDYPFDPKLPANKQSKMDAFLEFGFKTKNQFFDLSSECPVAEENEPHFSAPASFFSVSGASLSPKKNIFCHRETLKLLTSVLLNYRNLFKNYDKISALCQAGNVNVNSDGFSVKGPQERNSNAHRETLFSMWNFL